MLTVLTQKEITKKAIIENGIVSYCPQHAIGYPQYFIKKTATGYRTFQMAGCEIFDKKDHKSLAAAKKEMY